MREGRTEDRLDSEPAFELLHQVRQLVGRYEHNSTSCFDAERIDRISFGRVHKVKVEGLLCELCRAGYTLDRQEEEELGRTLPITSSSG